MPSLQVFLLLLLLIYYIIMSEILIQAHLLNKHVLVLNDSIQMRISMYILIILSSCINFMAHWTLDYCLLLWLLQARCTGSTTTDTVISVILVIPWYINTTTAVLCHTFCHVLPWEVAMLCSRKRQLFWI